MQEHHGPTKETDITSALVIFFVLLVAVMIAKVAGDFTSKTTSTSSRASTNLSVGNLATKPKVVGRVSYRSGTSCSNPNDTTGSYKWWFNKCINVNKNECQESCKPGESIMDQTSYGSITCPNDKRCLPLAGVSDVKSQFSFTKENLSSTFCESITGKIGALCYDPSIGLNIKNINISMYDAFYTQDKNTNYGEYEFYKKGKNFFWSTAYGNYYWVECPLYVTVLRGGMDAFNAVLKVNTSSVDHVKSGYCYVPKETQTP